jgi:hypothetical protein
MFGFLKQKDVKICPQCSPLKKIPENKIQLCDDCIKSKHQLVWFSIQGKKFVVVAIKP